MIAILHVIVNHSLLLADVLAAVKEALGTVGKAASSAVVILTDSTPILRALSVSVLSCPE